MSIKSVFADLPQYPFTREEFSNAFYKCISEEVSVHLLSEYKFTTDNFLFQRVDDEFYIIHLPSGIVINWYKHVGRCNTCNKEGFTYDNLLCFFKMFVDEYLDKYPMKRKTEGFVVNVTSEGLDVNSMYPKILKIAMNSIYGVTKEDLTK